MKLTCRTISACDPRVLWTCVGFAAKSICAWLVCSEGAGLVSLPSVIDRVQLRLSWHVVLTDHAPLHTSICRSEKQHDDLEPFSGLSSAWACRNFYTRLRTQ
eukprot:3777871-Amphidinium_carterae.1